MTFVSALVVLAAVGVCVWWLRGTRRPTPDERLVGLCHGDRSMAERLIAFEQKRSPGLSRTQAATRAIESRQRDNR